MQTFTAYTKVKDSKPTYTVADLIPFGQENAISRERLLQECIHYNICGSDRAMRMLIQKCRIDYVILARDGGGYYRPTRDDMADLQRYIKQERSRAISCHVSIIKAKKLYEDYKRGLDGDA